MAVEPANPQAHRHPLREAHKTPLASLSRLVVLLVLPAAERLARAASLSFVSLSKSIVEPLVQCAAGIALHDPEYLRLARALCDRYEVHLMVDEIAVGFGRTGTMFAHQQAGIRPDFICLSKGLTGGTLPLSAVL